MSEPDLIELMKRAMDKMSDPWPKAKLKRYVHKDSWSAVAEYYGWDVNTPEHYDVVLMSSLPEVPSDNYLH